MSVLDAIKNHKTKEIAKSISSAERYETQVSNLANMVKKNLRDEGQAVTHPNEWNTRAAYRKHLSQYKGTKKLVDSEMSPRSLAYWGRVYKRVVEADVSIEQFMLAQFDWFDRNFGTAPKEAQLTTDTAVDRARTFDGKRKKVTSGAKKHKVDFASLMRESDKMMRELCKAQRMTRKEVYKNLVIPGIYTFPKEFLEADPAYREVISGR